jgi:hypothetical protein
VGRGEAQVLLSNPVLRFLALRQRLVGGVVESGFNPLHPWMKNDGCIHPVCGYMRLEQRRNRRVDPTKGVVVHDRAHQTSVFGQRPSREKRVDYLEQSVVSTVQSA